MTDIEITLPDLSRVALEPGDKLLVRHPKQVSQVSAEAIRANLKKTFPDHDVLFMDNGLELSVLRPVDSAAPDAPLVAPNDVEGPTGLQLDLLCALQRIMQVEQEETPEGFMWHRVVTCDVPRLTKYLTPETIAWLRQEFPDDDGSWRP